MVCLALICLARHMRSCNIWLLQSISLPWNYSICSCRPSGLDTFARQLLYYVS